MPNTIDQLELPGWRNLGHHFYTKEAPQLENGTARVMQLMQSTLYSPRTLANVVAHMARTGTYPSHIPVAYRSETVLESVTSATLTQRTAWKDPSSVEPTALRAMRNAVGTQEMRDIHYVGISIASVSAGQVSCLEREHNPQVVPPDPARSTRDRAIVDGEYFISYEQTSQRALKLPLAFIGGHSGRSSSLLFPHRVELEHILEEVSDAMARPGALRDLNDSSHLELLDRVSELVSTLRYWAA